MLFPLIATMLIVYIAFLVWFISRRYLRWWVPVAPVDPKAQRYRLARTMRMLLSFIHFFAFFAVIVWVPASIVMVLSARGNPDWSAEFSILTDFRLDLAGLPGGPVGGLLDQVIHGTTTIHVDFLNGAQWLIFALGAEAAGILSVFVILQLRNIFAELSNGTPFKAANERRLRRIGIVLLVAYTVQPFWLFFMWGAVINGIDIAGQTFALLAPFDFNVTALLLGLGLIAFSGAMREGEELETENRLTI